MVKLVNVISEGTVTICNHCFYLQDTELHVHEWKQCLNGVKRVLESASTAIKKHNLSLNTKKEVFESDKGKEFFNSKELNCNFYHIPGHLLVLICFLSNQSSLILSIYSFIYSYIIHWL